MGIYIKMYLYLLQHPAEFFHFSSIFPFTECT